MPSHISRLQATVHKLGLVAQIDQDAFTSNRALHPPTTHGYNGHILWKNSQADRMLKIDIANGEHLRLTPTELCGTRTCYEPFGAARIGKRIDQLVEKAKPYGAKSKKRKSKNLPEGCPARSRKDTQAPYDNSY